MREHSERCAVSEPAGRAVQCKEKGERGAAVEEGLRGQAAGLVFFTGTLGKAGQVSPEGSRESLHSLAPSPLSPPGHSQPYGLSITLPLQPYTRYLSLRVQIALSGTHLQKCNRPGGRRTFIC